MLTHPRRIHPATLDKAGLQQDPSSVAAAALLSPINHRPTHSRLINNAFRGWMRKGRAEKGTVRLRFAWDRPLNHQDTEYPWGPAGLRVDEKAAEKKLEKKKKDETL